MKRSSWGLIFLGVCAFTFVVSCSDDELTDNEYVNNWIQSQMQQVYFWNEGMPSPRKSQDPAAYFSGLRSVNDRFSWIQNNYEDLINSLNGVNKEAGYEFKLYLKNNNDIEMQIMYIKTGSLVDTENIDLIRGDVITEVNGTTITYSNYEDILSKLSDDHTITYSRFNFETETWENKGEVTLHTAQFAENPNLMHEVVTVGDRKIGYYVYNFFAEGPTEGSTVYDNQMASAFGDFKAAGITDLVIDFRFNSGGSIASSAKLASLIGNGVDANDVYTKFQYNDDLQEYFIQEFGEDDLKMKFVTAANNVGSLIGNRVYFLTGRRTASASELVINGLKPYMNQIILIGDTTIGKNVGSTSIYKRNDPRNKWGMQPIIVKLYNSQNQADYDEGFFPDIVDQDNELEIYPLGNKNEELLSRAIDHITGSVTARQSRKSKSSIKEIGTSADFKRGSYNLIMNDPLTKGWVDKNFIRNPNSF